MVSKDHFMRWCCLLCPPALLRTTKQPLFPTHVPLHVRTHLTCRLGLTWAYKIRNQSPDQLGSPSISLLGNSGLPRQEAPSLRFPAVLLARQSEIKAVTHLGFLSYFVNFLKFLLLSPPFKHPFKGEMKSNHLQRKWFQNVHLIYPYKKFIITCRL